jgi:hypothetical protein
VLANTIFEDAVEKIFDVTKRFASALEAAAIPYRVVGGLAVFVHVDARDPMAARLTKDVDVAIDRKNLDAIRAALEPYGFTFRHVAGVDMFVDANNPNAIAAVHLLFAGERVSSDDVEVVPFSLPEQSPRGFMIAPVVDLVHMKLTSYRLKDQVHVQDLDHAGLITPEIEMTLSAPLLARLKEVRSKR